jgi:ABC-type nitrate/sulfonate/bicarbonate transport system substrate-binding protein
MAVFAWDGGGAALAEKISLGYPVIGPTMSGNFMAKEIGAFEKYGLDVDLVYVGPPVIQALAGGSMPIAWAASNAVVAAVLRGAPIIGVASNTEKPSMSLWVQPEITEPAQLQGKILGITRFGTASDIVSRLVLRKLGLEGKVDIRQFGGAPELEAAFRTGIAHGIMNPFMPASKARELVNPADLGIPFSMTMLAVRNDFLKTSRPTVEKIVMAYMEGIIALRTRKKQGVEVVGKYLRQRAGSAQSQYDYALRYLALVPRIDPAAVDSVIEMLGHPGQAKQPIFDNSIVDKLLKDGFADRLLKAGTK